MAEKQISTRTGTVTTVNRAGTGIRLDGEEKWWNLSKFHDVMMPEKGAHVELTLEGDFINAIRLVGPAASANGSHPAQHAGPSPAAGAWRTPAALNREVALREANIYCQSLPRPADAEVMLLADRFYAWLNQDDTSATESHGASEPAGTTTPTPEPPAAPASVRMASPAQLTRLKTLVTAAGDKLSPGEAMALNEYDADRLISFYTDAGPEPGGGNE